MPSRLHGYDGLVTASCWKLRNILDARIIFSACILKKVTDTYPPRIRFLIWSDFTCEVIFLVALATSRTIWRAFFFLPELVFPHGFVSRCGTHFRCFLFICHFFVDFFSHFVGSFNGTWVCSQILTVQQNQGNPLYRLSDRVIWASIFWSISHLIFFLIFIFTFHA